MRMSATAIKRLTIDWSIKESIDFKPVISRYRNYLIDHGFRDSSIISYVGAVERYLDFAKTDRPSPETASKFKEQLHMKKLSRSTINNYSFAIKKYHEMLGEEISLPYLNRNKILPYYFDQDDVLRIFSSCHNLKHYAMMQTLFYGCLRASELCNLDDDDVDFKARTLRIRLGKGGKDGMVLLNDECLKVLRQYLEVRPPLKIDGHSPLFYTDYGRRWDRRDVYRVFITYKQKAGIEKHGGVHVFSRHTPATIMIAKGCDIRIVQEVLRHNDIRTTLRYAHVSDQTKREMYEQFLKL
jgi:integrase/recombinase XerD